MYIDTSIKFPPFNQGEITIEYFFPEKIAVGIIMKIFFNHNLFIGEEVSLREKPLMLDYLGIFMLIKR